MRQFMAYPAHAQSTSFALKIIKALNSTYWYTLMKTFSQSAETVTKAWHLVDADGMVLGRLAAEVAKILRGKHKATYTPHIDDGDYVVIINAEKVRLTGRKLADKSFFWHTGYPGGIKERRAGQILDGAHPERLIEKAVQRMIPRSPLGRQQMRNLRIFKGPDHTHEAQMPVPLDLKARNRKNSIEKAA